MPDGGTRRGSTRGIRRYPRPAGRSGRPLTTGRVDLTIVLLTVAWLYVIAPRLVQAMLGSRNRLAVGETVPAVPMAARLEQLLLWSLIATCLIIVALRSTAIPTDRRMGLVVMLAPWAYVVGRDLYLADRAGVSALLYPLLVISLWVLRPPLQRLVAIGVTTSVAAMISLAMGILVPARGIFQSAEGEIVTTEKEILPFGLLMGPFQGGNNLGRLLVLGLPFLLLVRGRGRRVALVVPILAALVWSSSRSSLSGLGVAVGLALLIALFPGTARRPAAFVGLIGIATFMTVLPLLTTDPGAFTNRGLIWGGSLAEWHSSPVFGMGSGWYAQAAEYGTSIASTAYTGHNQFVHVAVTGGWVGIAVFGLMLGYLIVVAAHWAGRGQLLPTAYLAVLLVSCTFEVSIGVVDRESLLVAATAAMALIAFADRRPGMSGRPSVHQRPTTMPATRAPVWASTSTVSDSSETGVR